MFRKALYLKEDWAEAYNNLGNVLKGLRKLPEALECYHKAILYKPDWVDVYNNIGSLLMELGNLEEAQKNFNKVINLKPDDYNKRYITLLSMQYESNFSQENGKRNLKLIPSFFLNFPRLINIIL